MSAGVGRPLPLKLNASSTGLIARMASARLEATPAARNAQGLLTYEISTEAVPAFYNVDGVVCDGTHRVQAGTVPPVQALDAKLKNYS